MIGWDWRENKTQQKTRGGQVSLSRVQQLKSGKDRNRVVAWRWVVLTQRGEVGVLGAEQEKVHSNLLSWAVQCKFLVEVCCRTEVLDSLKDWLQYWKCSFFYRQKYFITEILLSLSQSLSFWAPERNLHKETHLFLVSFIYHFWKPLPWRLGTLFRLNKKKRSLISINDISGWQKKQTVMVFSLSWSAWCCGW